MLLNFKTPGFAPAPGQTGDDPLLLEPVTIASVNAPGVLPRTSHAGPPGYAPRSEGDYNTTAGFLENGNQRCVCPRVLCTRRLVWHLRRAPHASSPVRGRGPARARGTAIPRAAQGALWLLLLLLHRRGRGIPRAGRRAQMADRGEKGDANQRRSVATGS